MGTFVILSRISPDSFSNPKNFRKLAEKVSEKKKRLSVCQLEGKLCNPWAVRCH